MGLWDKKTLLLALFTLLTAANGKAADSPCPKAQTLEAATQLLDTGDYRCALEGFNAIHSLHDVTQSTDHDYRIAEQAYQGLGVTLAATGNYKESHDKLKLSYELAAGRGHADIAALDLYDLALVVARKEDLVPITGKWFPLLRSPDDQKVKSQNSENMVAGYAKGAYVIADEATDPDLYIKARLLEATYDYALISDVNPDIDEARDNEIFDRLDEARIKAELTGNYGDLIGLADIAIGHWILDKQRNGKLGDAYKALAFRSLKSVMASHSDELNIAWAAGLLGRLYGLDGRLSEAVSLTGEANIYAERANDLLMQLEFDLQAAALFERANYIVAARDRYKAIKIHIKALQPVLRSQHNLERRAYIRHLMSQGLNAYVEFMLKNQEDGKQQETFRELKRRH